MTTRWRRRLAAREARVCCRSMREQNRRSCWAPRTSRIPAMARKLVNRAPRLQTQTLPPPVGGLNTLDAVANMPPTDAVILDNYFPGTADVPLRNGYQVWGSGLTNVETLAVYTSGTQKKMFAVAKGSLYDVSANQAIGSGNVVVEGPFMSVSGQTTLALSQRLPLA